MRICVTGAAGFIGSHVIRRLAGEHDLVGIDDLSTGSAANIDGVALEFVEGSILDSKALDQAVEGADVIVHLAARPSVPRSIIEPLATHEANATGTLRVLEVARRRNAHVIVASSSSVYGANPVLPKHEGLMTAPVSPYAVSKLATEQYSLAWQHSYGLPVLAFRFFNVFGPRQAPGHAYAAVIPSFVHSALCNRPLTVHGDGQQSRDFTYVGTVADVIADAIARRVTCAGPVNLAFGTRTSLMDLIRLIEKAMGFPLRIDHSGPRAGDVAHSQADNTLLASLFPTIEPVSLPKGIEETLEWMSSWLTLS